MSRKKNGSVTRSVTVHFSEEFAFALDNYIVGLGLADRASGLIALAEAGMSSLPLESMLGSVLQQCVKELKREEFQALADHYASRAVLMQSAVTPPGYR